ncbi:MAG: NADH-quinone oxidoreductase subunit C [Candidatus Gastranaerophilales bacterium]|nr:NADH-quinone oxidoreductase subunit C [Candidatus Gastranaerophilales bacterium]
MKWITSKNNRTIDVKEIPVLDINELRSKIIDQYKANRRVVGFFGCNEDSAVRIYAILANDYKSELLISSAYIRKEKSYPSITKEIPAFHMFERELYEEFGIEPAGHPWLKPVRYSKNRFDKTQEIANYPFFKMDGEEIHEVAVGPIHAGIIEPGHFRFMCNGEKVYHLEIQLGYQHRGIENLLVKKNDRFMSNLAESITGDTVIGQTIAYTNAIESLLNLDISDKAGLIRVVTLELERIAVHIGDLGAIANDIAYLMSNAVFGATRTLVINTLLSICGSRFGRGLIRVGGVTFDLDNELISKISKTLDKVEKDVDRMTNTMFASASVLSRLEKTGIVSKEKARELGLVGMAARASGLSLDSRIDHPWGWYKDSFIDKELLDSGDVFARTYIRYKEIKQSIHIIKDLLYKIQVYDKDVLLTQSNKSLSKNSLVVSIVEGWRGEIVHTAITDNDGRICRYKIKDPSFNNWYGLALAVRNNGISDFPVCNKSFNLSYCGNDL